MSCTEDLCTKDFSIRNKTGIPFVPGSKNFSKETIRYFEFLQSLENLSQEESDQLQRLKGELESTNVAEDIKRPRGITIPVLHEILCGAQLLGHLIARDKEGFKQIQKDYLNGSVIGSLVTSFKEQDEAKAKELRLKALGALSSSLDLGLEIPVLHEIALLGRVGSDVASGLSFSEAVEGRYQEWKNHSIIGSTSSGIIHAIHGQTRQATRLFDEALKTFACGMIQIASVVLTGFGSFGIAAICSRLFATFAGGLMGALSNIISHVSQALIRDQDVRGGELIGSGIVGGVAGAVGGNLAKPAIKAAVKNGSVPPIVNSLEGVKAVALTAAENTLTPKGSITLAEDMLTKNSPHVEFSPPNDKTEG